MTCYELRHAPRFFSFSPVPNNGLDFKLQDELFGWRQRGHDERRPACIVGTRAPGTDYTQNDEPDAPKQSGDEAIERLGNPWELGKTP